MQRPVNFQVKLFVNVVKHVVNSQHVVNSVKMNVKIRFRKKKSLGNEITWLGLG